mmetsp:Transcript_31021/g.30568  ORF Transcript_31021/g.30568 Transcript_31021/m.30568 type:complete len:106 (-) Transcript_31021:68-385(-)
MLEEQKVKNLRTQVDMGCNFYVQAEVPDTETLIVEIGMGIFIELNRKQTLNLCEQKNEIFEKQTNLLKQKISDIKAHKRFVLEAIREIMQLEPEAKKKEPELRFM